MLRYILMVCLLSTPMMVAGAAEEVMKEGHEAEYAAALDALNLNGKALLEKMKKFIPDDMSHKTVIVPMRDGTGLPTEVFVPPGEGPWSVALLKSHYGRAQIIRYAQGIHKRSKQHGRLVYVAMSTRRAKDTVRVQPLEHSDDNTWEEKDSYDAVEWCAQQPWCNGKVYMVGGSGNGICSFAAGISRPPHLVYASPGSSGADFRHDWTFHNGVRRGMYEWIESRPKLLPTLREYSATKRLSYLKDQAKEANPLLFYTNTGWYDITIEASLDYFEAFGPLGNVFVRISGGGHVGPVKFNGNRLARPLKSKTWAQSEDFVKSIFKDEVIKRPSQLLYVVLGDMTDPKASGGIMRRTNVWPVPHTPTSFYLHPDGKLSQNISPAASGSCSFDYDPKNPVTTIGGNIYSPKEGFEKSGAGPKDQRVFADRTDILRFESEPLTAPLEITGKIKAQIYLETDVPDTTVTVKLIDIYPDGYQAIIRDSIVMARYHSGYETPSPLEKGHVYELEMDMWSIAAMFNTGHKIAVHVSSSNTPKYEVHPNSYEQVTGYENAPVAHNTIHCSQTHASRIILPVVEIIQE